jgi:hypothetical protein
MVRNQLKLATVLVAGLLCVAPPVFGDDSQAADSSGEAHATDHRLNAEALEERGKQLLTEIEQRYRKLSSAPRLTGSGDDISDIVIKYIPIGTSFDDAEDVLRAAGFHIDDPRVTPRPDNWLYPYDVVASIVPFHQYFFSRTNLYVNLSPKNPGDYHTVNSVSAGLVELFP